MSEQHPHPSPAGDAPTPSAPTVSEDVLDRERRLLPTFDLLSELPGFQVGGLAPEGDKILVYWNGDFGREARAIVEDANRRGIVVDVVPVSYAVDELREIAGRLASALAAKGIELDGYGIGFDQISVWGSAFESAEARRIADATAAGMLPFDLGFAIIASPGDVTPAPDAD